MKIERIQISVAELKNGYQERGAGGIEGVVAYGGLLDVRPPYQREFIYAPKERDEVIRTVKKGFPLNTMYWAKNDDGRFELMDGQQRTISICRYAGEHTFAVDKKYYFNLDRDLQKQIDDYILDIYICDGTPSEVHEWFKVINIAGKPLTAQELRNTAYTGTWLSDAKIHFSKPTCSAYNMAKNYMSGSPIRQEYLETAIKWIADRDGLESIEDYMAIHQHDENANAIWTYFKDVIEWVHTIFPKYRREMKGIEWGLLYNTYGNTELDSDALEKEIKRLMMDDDVTNKKGIYFYVLTYNERHLNIREFTDNQKRQAYERQNGVCPICNKHFTLEQMHGDHIVPWHAGGKTIPENLQMLCRDCNLKKSGQE
ncbi:MAG: DUF262 domain-containing protein [Ruminococcus sp.]|nr:DUF262 domain-containing protein [Ruminococcus sp.]